MVRLDILHIFEKFAKKRPCADSSMVIHCPLHGSSEVLGKSEGSTFRSPTTLIGFIGDFLVMYTQEIHFYCKI